MTEKFLTTRVRPAFAALLLFLMTGLCAADGVFKWYLHTDKVNETKAAIAAALDNNRPLLIFVGKPGCANCELVWSGPKYLLGETKMADFLEQERIVGLKIEDTTGHFTNLCDAKNYYTDIYGVSGKKVNSTAPLFFFFKVKSSARGKLKTPTLTRS